MIWSLQWGDQLKFLLAMQAKGMVIPALRDRPTIPLHLEAARTCMYDIMSDGQLGFADCMAWADRYGYENPEELWDVISVANSRIQEWRRTNTQRKESPRPGPTDSKAGMSKLLSTNTS